MQAKKTAWQKTPRRIWPFVAAVFTTLSALETVSGRTSGTVIMPFLRNTRPVDSNMIPITNRRIHLVITKCTECQLPNDPKLSHGHRRLAHACNLDFQISYLN